MTDRASAEGHRYDHDGMHRHHHEYGPTGRAIWWENADQFGGDFTEHAHAAPDRADLRAAVATFLREWDAGEGDEYAMVERLRAALSTPDQPPAWFGDPNWPDSPAAPDRADQ